MYPEIFRTVALTVVRCSVFTQIFSPCVKCSIYLPHGTCLFSSGGSPPVFTLLRCDFPSSCLSGLSKAEESCSISVCACLCNRRRRASGPLSAQEPRCRWEVKSSRRLSSPCPTPKPSTAFIARTSHFLYPPPSPLLLRPCKEGAGSLTKWRD